MAKKVSKNSKIDQRSKNAALSKQHVKVVKSIKDPVTGKYSYQEMIIHKEKIEEFFASK